MSINRVQSGSAKVSIDKELRYGAAVLSCLGCQSLHYHSAVPPQLGSERAGPGQELVPLFCEVWGAVTGGEEACPSGKGAASPPLFAREVS